MLKKVSAIFVIVLSLTFAGCASKEELVKSTTELKEENAALHQELKEYQKIDSLLEFYNKITTSTVNSLVLVESTNKITSNKVYANGLVVANDYYYYYVVTDYTALKQSGNNTYRVLDASATVYSADIANRVDEESGLVLLRVDISRQTSIQMKTSDLGASSNIYANVSSINQINKVHVYSKLKTSTTFYNGTSYVSYTIENAQNGSILINNNNEVFGIYLSKLDCFINTTTLKAII